MDEPIIKLNCYEPAGAYLEWSREDLFGHTLVLGGSGSGKTTRAIYPAVEQLIQFHDSDPLNKHALIIIDTKNDGEMLTLVSRACSKSGRMKDLVVLNGGFDYIDPLQAMVRRGFSGVEETASLMATNIPGDTNNRYWERTFEVLLRQALRLLLISGEPLSMSNFLDLLIRYLLHHRQRDPYFVGLIKRIEKPPFDGLDIDPLQASEIESTHQTWELLDYRTRSILQSMAASVVSPLNQPVTRSYFEGERLCDLQDATDSGKIVLVCVDAISEPEAARMLGIIVKAQFYQSILHRKPSQAPLRPAGLIMDDWTLSATGRTGTRFSDVDALSMIRSRLGYLIAAAQGFYGLDLAIGELSRRAAQANFANLVFFRSRDSEIDALASAYLGQRKDKLIDMTLNDRPSKPSRVDYPIRHEREIRVPAVPTGALARLATGDCYAMIGPRIYNQAHCLIPTFSNQTQEPPR